MIDYCHTVRLQLTAVPRLFGWNVVVHVINKIVDDGASCTETSCRNWLPYVLFLLRRRRYCYSYAMLFVNKCSSFVFIYLWLWVYFIVPLSSSPSLSYGFIIAISIDIFKYLTMRNFQSIFLVIRLLNNPFTFWACKQANLTAFDESADIYLFIFAFFLCWSADSFFVSFVSPSAISFLVWSLLFFCITNAEFLIISASHEEQNTSGSGQHTTVIIVVIIKHNQSALRLIYFVVSQKHTYFFHSHCDLEWCRY